MKRPCTTSGSTNTWKPEFAKYFEGALVILVPDNDEPGKKFMGEIANDLFDVAGSLSVLQLPGLSPKEDVTDYIESDWQGSSAKERFDALFSSSSLVEITSKDDITTYITGNVTAEPELEVLNPGKEYVQPVAVNGAEILNGIEAFLRKYVVFPSEPALTAVVLWAAHTWVASQFYTTPRLYLSSAEKGSGKTRALECLGNVCYKPRQTINTSVAALFRIIEDQSPTILLDEADTIFSAKGSDSKEDLRAILNAGYKKGAMVERCEGRDFKVRSHKVFTPVALAGIGKLPDTIMSRSVVIRMKKRSRNESISSYREKGAESDTRKLKIDLENWSLTLCEIGDDCPDLPKGVEDRNAEVWEPLIAIADRAGGQWPTRAREAALSLIGSVTGDDTQSIGIQLLGDIKKVFETTMSDKISSVELLGYLHAMEESSWADFYGKPFNAHNLAKKLKEYDIKPQQLWDGSKRDGSRMRGYLKSDFEESWVRYLPSDSLPTALSANLIGRSVDSRSDHISSAEWFKAKSASDQHSTDLSVQKGCTPVETQLSDGAPLFDDEDVARFEAMFQTEDSDLEWADNTPENAQIWERSCLTDDAPLLTDADYWDPELEESL